MYINDTIDKVLSESLGDSEFRELLQEGALDGFKQRVMNGLFSGLTLSITRCLQDSIVKTDLFKAIQSTKGDIGAYQLYGNDHTFEDINSVLLKTPSTKKNAVNMKIIYDFLNRRKRDFMRGFKTNNAFVKITYVSLVSAMTTLGGLSVCELTKAGKPKNIGLDITINALVANINNHSLDKLLQSQDKLFITESSTVPSDTINKALGAMGIGAVATIGAASTGLGAVAIGAALISVVVAFLISAKLIVFYIYESRIKLSDFLYQNALLLELHKREVENNADLTDAEKTAIIAKQKKIASLLLKISEKIAVDSITSKRKADDADKRDTENIVRDSKDHGSDGDTGSSDDGDIVI